MTFYGSRKFTILMLSMILLMVSRLAMLGRDSAQIVVDFFGIVLIAAAVVVLCESRKNRGVAFVLGFPPIGFIVASHLVPGYLSKSVYFIGRGMTALFLSFLVTVLIRAVLSARTVTWDTIIGAFCGYVLIAVVWGDLYCAAELASPGSFAMSAVSAEQFLNPDRRRQELEYFSFSTLSTLGYGDITPVSPVARALACFEALIGQFYLAVLVAGLVGVHASGKSGGQNLSS